MMDAKNDKGYSLAGPYLSLAIILIWDTAVFIDNYMYLPKTGNG